MKMKKLLAVVLALTVALTMGFATTATAFAANDGTITIENAAKGEEYGIVKLFDAKISGDAITYQGDIPAALKDVFVKNAAGNIVVAEGKTDKEVTDAVQAWAEDQTPTAKKTADGSAVTFTGLEYGYYAVTSTQGATITIDSAKPNATVYDKNTSDVDISKEVEKESYSIGDTVKYTATVETVTYLGEGKDAKQVTKYVVSDTLPEFLADATVTAIKVDGTAIDTQQFDANKSITIPWVDANGNSLYKNGAVLTIEYQATLTSVTNINAKDINEITVQPYVKNGDKEEPWEENWKDDAEIITYAAALKKVDENGKALAGAKFTFKGLVVTGEAGEYTVVSYDPNGAESAQLDTDAEGKLYIVGLASDVELAVTEAVAPDGYNKLTDPATLTPQVLSTAVYKTSGTVKYDAKGNVVEQTSSTTSSEVKKNLSDLDEKALEIVNNSGSTLPSTGGIGTTIFYILGALLIVGCGVMLIARRRSNNA